MERALLTRDDLRMIEALVQSPAYASYLKLIDHHKDVELRGLVEAEGIEIHRIQGRIRGLDLLRNLPLIMAEQAKKLDEIDQKKEEAEAEDKKRRRRK